MLSENNKVTAFISLTTLAVIGFFVSLSCFTIVDVGHRGVYVSMGSMSNSLVLPNSSVLPTIPVSK